MFAKEMVRQDIDWCKKQRGNRKSRNRITLQQIKVRKKQMKKMLTTYPRQYMGMD
jgi:hypothetical protein